MNFFPRDTAGGGLPPGAFSSLLQCLAALRNRRAMTAMLGCLGAGFLTASLFSLLASRLGFAIGLLGVFSLIVAGTTGLNAAGLLLMEQARGVPHRPLKEALLDGLACVPKFVLLALVLFAAALAVFAALALAYLVCKIPGLGPVLFVAVFPVSVVLAGATLCSLFVCLVLALPAIWEGEAITRALAQVLAIARSRLIEALLLLAVVGVLAGVVGFILFGVLFVGLLPAIGLASALLGGEGIGAAIGLGGIGPVGSGYGLAAGIGGGLLWVLAGALPLLVSLLGLNLVYLRVTEGLDTVWAEVELKARFDEAKRQATTFGQRAKDAAGRAVAVVTQPNAPGSPINSKTASPAPMTAPEPAPEPRTRPAPLESTTPAVAKTLTCPQCLAAIGKNDVYCGVCGHRLK